MLTEERDHPAAVKRSGGFGWSTASPCPHFRPSLPRIDAHSCHARATMQSVSPVPSPRGTGWNMADGTCLSFLPPYVVCIVSVKAAVAVQNSPCRQPAATVLLGMLSVCVELRLSQTPKSTREMRHRHVLAHPLIHWRKCLEFDCGLFAKVRSVGLSQNTVLSRKERVSLSKWISTNLILGLIASIPCPSNLFG